MSACVRAAAWGRLKQHAQQQCNRTSRSTTLIGETFSLTSTEDDTHDDGVKICKSCGPRWIMSDSFRQNLLDSRGWGPRESVFEARVGKVRGSGVVQGTLRQ